MNIGLDPTAVFYSAFCHLPCLFSPTPLSACYLHSLHFFLIGPVFNSSLLQWMKLFIWIRAMWAVKLKRIFIYRFCLLCAIRDLILPFKFSSTCAIQSPKNSNHSHVVINLYDAKWDILKNALCCNFAYNKNMTSWDCPPKKWVKMHHKVVAQNLSAQCSVPTTMCFFAMNYQNYSFIAEVIEINIFFI